MDQEIRARNVQQSKNAFWSEMSEDYYFYRFLFNIILGPTVTILGLIGNVLCILAMLYRYYGKAPKEQTNGMKGHMYIFLTSLACADICFMTFVGINYFLTSSSKIQEEYKELRSNVIVPFCNAFKALSDFIVVFMTFDRFRIMSDIAELRLQSLRKYANENGKQRIVIGQILLALLMSFSLYFPYYFPTHKYTFHANATQSHGSQMHDVTKLEDLRVIIKVICIAITKVFPVTILVVLNILIIKRLKIVRQRRQRMTDIATIENRKINWSATSVQCLYEQKLAVLLVVIVCSFICLTLPANLAYLTYEVFFKLQNDKYNELLPLFAITNFMETVHYSANFYIYIAVHEEIRNAFIAFCKEWVICKDPQIPTKKEKLEITDVPAAI